MQRKDEKRSRSYNDVESRSISRSSSSREEEEENKRKKTRRRRKRKKIRRRRMAYLTKRNDRF